MRLVEQMLQFEQITSETASLGFERMRKSGSRLPWGEIEKMLTRY